MGAELICASPAKSGFGSSLDQLIDEISSLNGPSFRNLAFLDDSLLCKNLFLDRSSISSNVGSPSHHQLEHYHSKSVVIDLITVILFGHDLGSHITWSATCVS